MNFKKYFSEISSKNFLFYLLIDSLSATFIILLFFGFGKLLEYKAKTLSNGMSVEELKLSLLSGTVEFNQQYYLQIRNFALLIIFGTIIVIILTLIIYSLSRKIVWHRLLSQKFSGHKVWKWSLLLLMLFLALIIFTLVYKMFIILISSFTISSSNIISFVAVKLLNAIFLTTFLFFMLLLEYNFSKNSLIWNSVGQSLRWKPVWKVYLLSIIVWFLISIIIFIIISNPLMFVLERYLISSIILNTLILILFVIWIRTLIVDNMNSFEKMSS
jgi:hypothetical protein